MQYTQLTPERQAQMLRERITALESDHFGHQMNLDGLAAQPAGEDRDAREAYARACQEVIEAAHAVATDDLDKLDAIALDSTD